MLECEMVQRQIAR